MYSLLFFPVRRTFRHSLYGGGFTLAHLLVFVRALRYFPHRRASIRLDPSLRKCISPASMALDSPRRDVLAEITFSRSDGTLLSAGRVVGVAPVFPPFGSPPLTLTGTQVPFRSSARTQFSSYRSHFSPPSLMFSGPFSATSRPILRACLCPLRKRPLSVFFCLF